MKPASFIVSLLITALGLVALPLAVSAGPVNINTADAKTLAKELTGIGLARAQAIVEYRQKNGPFRTADDLANVKGIGKRVVEQNRSNIRLDKAPAGESSKGGKSKPGANAGGESDAGGDPH
jgi:competence protein ComEA